MALPFSFEHFQWQLLVSGVIAGYRCGWGRRSVIGNLIGHKTGNGGYRQGITEDTFLDIVQKIVINLHVIGGNFRFLSDWQNMTSLGFFT